MLLSDTMKALEPVARPLVDSLWQGVELPFMKEYTLLGPDKVSDGAEGVVTMVDSLLVCSALVLWGAETEGAVLVRVE